jgi:uncharacterized membrane protein YphA (DoxX/SURF4 family)
MTETVGFFLWLAASTALVAGAVLALRDPRGADARARAFFWLCVFAGGAVFLERAGIAGGLLRSVHPIEQAYALVRWIVLGAAAASAILALAAPGRAPFARSAWTLRGLCASTALGFLAIDAGKLAHDAEMREFFTASGYPVALMYAVMAAEVLGAIGLLLPRTRLYAAAALALLMLAAIATHAKNGDPFSDSLDAVRMLVLLGGVVVLALRVNAPLTPAVSPRERVERG